MREKLKNCRGCGKLFMSSGGARFCLDCIKKQHEDEERIIDYVSENPRCTMLEIVKALGINEAIVRRLIEEGRLLQAGVEYYYPCTRCGAPIVKGQYCDECAEKIRNEIAEMQEKLDEREGIGMRYKKLLETSTPTS